MKRFTFGLCFLAVVTICATAQSIVSVQPDVVLKELKFFSSLYPRNEGSAGESAAITHITSRLEALRIPYVKQGLQDIEGTHSYSSSILVTIPGKRPDELLFIVPLDQRPGASRAEDGSINLALALGMIESLRSQEPPVSLRFLFLGGEFGQAPTYPIGTHQFLASFYPTHPVIALYLDFQSIPNRTNITSGGVRVVAPYWLINRCSQAMDKAGLYYLERGNQNQIFRLGLVANPPLINDYLHAGYPALELSGIGGSLPSQNDAQWIASFERFFNDFVAANRSGFPTAWDRHYLFFQAKLFSFIITERAYVLIVLVVFGLLLAYPIVARKRFARYLDSIWRNAVSIPLFMIVVFLFLFLATLLVEAIFLARNFPSMWRQAPLIFFACKFTAALFLSALLYRFLARLPFSRSGRFYGNAAVLLLLVDCIVLGILNFSLAYYFVWALGWSVLFSLVRSRTLKILCLLVSTAWLVKVLVDIFTLPALEVVRVMLLSRFKGNAVLALALLPFLFMTVRVDFLFRHPHRKRAITIVRAIDTLLGVATAGLIVVLVRLAPYSAAHPQPVVAQEIVNLDAPGRAVQLTSPAPLGNLAIAAAGFSTHIDTRAREYSARLPGSIDLLHTSLREATFLDRRLVNLRLEPVGQPSEVHLTLTSTGEIVIFDANFPFTYNSGATTATIHIGKNPPFPLDVQLTLPQNTNVELHITLIYTSLPTPLEVTGHNIAVARSLVVTKGISVGAS